MSTDQQTGRMNAHARAHAHTHTNVYKHSLSLPTEPVCQVLLECCSLMAAYRQTDIHTYRQTDIQTDRLDRHRGEKQPVPGSYGKFIQLLPVYASQYHFPNLAK